MISQFEATMVSIQRDFHSVFTPMPGQLIVLNAFFRDWVEAIFLRCGRKFSKTSCAIYCCWMFAALFEDSEVYYILDEKEHGRDILWNNGRLPRFFSTLPRNKGESREDYVKRRELGRSIENKYLLGDPNNTTMTMKFRNGSYITVDGAKNYASADGLSPTFVAFDEFKSHDYRYYEAMMPNLNVRDGRHMVLGTPPPIGEGEHYRKLEASFKREGRKRHIHAPSFQNIIVFPGGRTGDKFKRIEQEYKDAEEWHVFAREYLALDVVDTARRVFPHFTVEDHVHEHSKMWDETDRYWKDWDSYLVFDPGTTSCFAATMVMIHQEDKRFWVMGEIYETNMAKTTVREIWPKAWEKAMKINSHSEDWLIGYDVAAAWFANEVTAEYDIGLLPCDKKSTKGRGKEDQIAVMRSAMRTGRFAISDECPNTIKELVGYSLDENGKIPKRDDHAIDCLRYTMRFDNYDTVFHPADKVEVFKQLRWA